LPFSSIATVSPSRIADPALTCFLTAASMSGSEFVIFSSFLEKIVTLSPSLCIWTRAPSNFHSIAAVSISWTTLSMPGVICASIIFIGRLSSSESSVTSLTPPRFAAIATAPRSFVSMNPRSTSATGTSNAFAMESLTIPSPTPIRSSSMARRARYLATSGDEEFNIYWRFFIFTV